MRRKVLTIVCFFAAAVAVILTLMSVMSCSHQASPGVVQQQASPGVVQQWVQHDRNAPQPPVITPGEASTQGQPGKPPSDAIILFDGKDLSAWESVKGGPAKWKVGERLFRGSSAHWRHQNQAGLWRLPAPRGVGRSQPASRRRSGSRE